MYAAHTHAHTHSVRSVSSLTHGCEVTTGLHIMSKKNSIIDCDAEVKRNDSLLWSIDSSYVSLNTRYTFRRAVSVTVQSYENEIEIENNRNSNISLLLSNTRHNKHSRTPRSSYFWNVRMAPRVVGLYWCRNPIVVRFGNRLVIMRRSHWRQDGSIICQKSKSLTLFTKLQFYLSNILYYKNSIYKTSVRLCTRQYAFRPDSQQSILVKGR
jgi:hypothetical protein